MVNKSFNTNLNKAKTAKKDEFYTQLSDIERELGHYKDQFKNKVVFCNCDDPRWSNFWKYFDLNFEFLGLKKLVTTYYEKEKRSYKLEIVLDENGNKKDTLTKLKGNGDFRSDECVEILEESEVVVTNPPFSLFREYIAQLIDYDKKFIVIGNKNAITYKEIFPLDYFGVMGVPITFLDKYNPAQFEIVGSNRGVDQDPNGIYGKGSYLNGKETFKRLFIKRKQ